MGRTLTFNIFRYNPTKKNDKPHVDTFKMEETARLNIFTALNILRENQAPDLMYDFVCRAGICGSCGMMIKLLGDLSVDTGVWFREMSERLESWIHTNKEFDPAADEERMDNATAIKIYESERCIECGCCIAGCATAQVSPDFLGAAGLNRVGRFIFDPRDQRGDDEWFELIATDEGVFGCIGMMACDDVCPKDLPLLEVFAYIRRKMSGSVFKKQNK
jgi:fumarate reductase iron-sulfur subunit